MSAETNLKIWLLIMILMAAMPSPAKPVPSTGSGQAMSKVEEAELGISGTTPNGMLSLTNSNVPRRRRAEEPVYFADDDLKAVVEEALGITDPTPADMLGLTFLQTKDDGISNLTGLEYATNLQRLEIEWHQISDLRPLSGLTNLQHLSLENNEIGGNQISDISPLSGLMNLQYLCLDYNQISDISPVSELMSLRELSLYKNQVSDISPLSGLTSLRELYLGDNRISNISILVGLPNLVRLGLGDNKINNISVIAELHNLVYLGLGENQISDISPLSRLTSLETLYLYDNQISDISLLSSLTNLQYLSIFDNQIGDISPLSGLTSLQSLHLGGNQISNISSLSGLTNLTHLTLNNSQISDISVLSRLISLEWINLRNNQISDISALTGLTKLASLDLHSNPLNQHACNIYIPQIRENNPGISLSYDECMPPTIIYVDDTTGDDNNDGLTPETAFATISKAIDVAEDGDTVLVYSGIYTEEINFLGKAITVQGVATNDGVPILQNPDDFAASFYYSEGPDSILKNFVIRNSFMAIFIAGSSPTISNVTVVDNKYGIEAYVGSEPDISSSILWNNTDGDLFGCQARYSFIQRETQEVPVEGLISHWKFDEESGTTAYDSAGNNDGTIHGAQWTTGQINGALDLDGLDDYVELPDNEPVWLPQHNFTLSVWVYFNTDPASSGKTILDLNFAESGNQNNELGYKLGISPVALKLIFAMTTATNPDENLFVDDDLLKNRWYHIVAVRDGTIQAVYIDGRLNKDRVCSPEPIDFVGDYDNDKVNIGKESRAGNPEASYLEGIIDDVRIYNRALSTEEIHQLYFAGLSPMFVDPNSDDYHLRSWRGRYWPEHDIWVLDKVASPCIDGGDPMVDPSDEPMPNGGRINMGAYGGTAYASMSETVCICDDIITMVR